VQLAVERDWTDNAKAKKQELIDDVLELYDDGTCVKREGEAVELS
jgi:hypothetical protein